MPQQISEAELNTARVHFDTTMRRIESGEEETFPAEFVYRLADGTLHPLQVWREHRKLTQSDLSRTSGVAASVISKIERGNRNLGPKVAKKLAGALRTTSDMVMPVD